MTKSKFINKSLYQLERKTNLLSFIIFTLIVSIVMVVVIALYPSMQDVLSKMPAELKDVVNFDTALEYFNTEAIELWVLLGCIYTTWLAVKLTSGDFRNKNSELLYSLNMSRGEILRTKLLRLVINATLFNVVLAIVSFFSLWIFCGKVAVGGILIFLLFAWLVTMIVGMLMFGWGLMGKHVFSAFAGIVIVVMFFIIPGIAVSIQKVEWIGFLSPFTALYGDVVSNGFAGLLNRGASIIIWTFVSAGTLAFGLINFKNVDLD